MAPNRRLALGLVAVILGLSVVEAVLAWLYMPVQRAFLPASFLVSGGLVAFAAYRGVLRVERPLPTVPLLMGLVTVLSLPVLTAPFLQRISYGRHGLTVYGWLPVPYLDVLVDHRGLLWFREKNHDIQRAEIEALVVPGVKVVIVGTGWEEVAQVDPSVAGIEGVELRVMSTGAAFEAYNALVAEGEDVVLLAHTTC